MEIMDLKFGDTLVFEDRTRKFKVSLLVNIDNQDELSLGVDAPREISIDREEVYLRKQKNQSKANIKVGRQND